MKLSSTFNSNAEQISSTANFDWLISLVSAGILSLIVLVFYDNWLREKGVEPSFENSLQRWSMVRAQVQNDENPSSIVLLGASRMQGNINLTATKSRHPERNVYQLAMEGLPPFASLEDIADNTDFKGTVMVSLFPSWILEEGGKYDQAQLVDYYHDNWNWARWIDTMAADAVSNTFVFTDNRYRFRNAVDALINHDTIFQGVDYVNISEDRERRLDVDKIDLEQLRGRILWSTEKELADAGIPDRDAWQSSVAALKAPIEKIRARGGRVILIRMPSSGPVYQMEQTAFPRQLYWDSIVTGADSDAAIHFADYPRLLSFELADYSHLDRDDTLAFTHALFDIIDSFDADSNVS